MIAEWRTPTWSKVDCGGTANVAELTILCPGEEPRVVTIPRDGRIVVGRLPTCDVQLNIPQLSKTHLDIVCTPLGLKVRDLGSKNGTVLNGEPLRRLRSLEPGDVLILGASVRIYVEGMSDVMSIPEEEALPDAVETLLKEGPELVSGPARQEIRTLQRNLHALRWANRGLARISRESDTHSRLRILLDEAHRIFPGSCAAVTWRGDVIESQGVHYSAFLQVGKGTLLPSPSEVPRSILGHMARNGGPIWSENALQDERFSAHDSVRTLALETVGCIPVGAQAAVLIFPETRALPSASLRRRIETLCELAGPLINPPPPEETTEELERVPGLIGRSKAIQALAEQILEVASVPWNVLLVGEEGTGKATIARAIHGLSRPSEPFVAGHTAVSDDQELERYFFGPGPVVGGWVAEAQAGTLFIKYVENLPPQLQSRWLTTLSTNRPTPLADDWPSNLHPRIISATTYASAIPSGLRSDLYDRLAEVVLHVPPLRERREDIPLLAEHFFCSGRQAWLDAGGAPDWLPKHVDPPVLDVLMQLRFEGNVRQLRAMIHRAVHAAAKSQAKTVLLAHFESLDGHSQPLPARDTHFRGAISSFAQRLLRRALDDAGGIQPRAAEALGMTERAWHRARRTYGFHPAEES